MSQSLVTGGREVNLPFNREPIVMKPVTCSEFIQTLREQVANTKRMPSSIGELIHSKPEYFEGRDFESFISQCLSFSPHPTYARWERENNGGECYVVMPVNDLTIIAALTSLRLWVGIPGNGEHWIWEWPENLPLCIDRIDLAKQFNQLN